MWPVDISIASCTRCCHTAHLILQALRLPEYCLTVAAASHQPALWQTFCRVSDTRTKTEKHLTASSQPLPSQRRAPPDRAATAVLTRWIGQAPCSCCTHNCSHQQHADDGAPSTSTCWISANTHAEFPPHAGGRGAGRARDSAAATTPRQHDARTLLDLPESRHG